MKYNSSIGWIGIRLNILEDGDKLFLLICIIMKKNDVLINGDGVEKNQVELKNYM